MSYVGFEPTIPDSELVQTAHALDRSTTVTGWWRTYQQLIFEKVVSKLSVKKRVYDFWRLAKRVKLDSFIRTRED
jgi:hypothetical protein